MKGGGGNTNLLSEGPERRSILVKKKIRLCKVKIARDQTEERRRTPAGKRKTRVPNLQTLKEAEEGILQKIK